ncbi:hypothetical protein [Streptomyces sp. NPDC001404]|uniref:hypothetical protein n=1 Tax=Streptomyces sp. NPDC001404 TaxID=3364571 RepID=UPI0036C46B70
MKLRKTAVAGILSSVALSALVVVGQAAPASAMPGGSNTCATYEMQGKDWLMRAGAPTDANNWQGVQAALVKFENAHHPVGAAETKLRDILAGIHGNCAK